MYWDTCMSHISLQVISLLGTREESTPQLRDKEWLNCVLLSPVLLEELQEHSSYQPPHEMAQQVHMYIVLKDYTHLGLSFIYWDSKHTVNIETGDDYIASVGCNNCFMLSFPSPTQTALKRRLSWRILMCGEKFTTARYIGHNVCLDDLHSGTPSVNIIKPRRSGVVSLP